jgi:alpha-L-fucosidase
LKGKLDLTDPPEFRTDFETFVDSLDVDLATGRENVEIRYTKGTSEPGTGSPVFTAPVRLKNTTTLNARCFRDGKPVSGTVTKVFKKVTPVSSSGVIGEMTPGLHYSYYEGAFDSLPDYGKFTPLKEGTVPDFDFSARGREDLFSFVFSGVLQVPETSVYEFYTSSDDGSRLYIDNKPVVDNDGLHGLTEKSGTIALEKGYHRIRVAYFDRTGSDNLLVMVKSQRLPKQILPKEWLFYN